MRQLPLDLAWAPLPPFAGFLPGANAAVVASLRDDAWPGAPAYLWGPAGSGKTALLREAQARAAAAHLEAQWFDAGTPLPWRLGEQAALVLVDDVQALDAERQHAAFTLFVEAASRAGDRAAGAATAPPLGVQFASAGRFPPVDLPVREDLRSRLGWGAVHALQPLGESETRVALAQEAARRGLLLGEDVLDYLLSRFARDLGSLMRLLHRLDDFALAEKRPLTIPLLRRMLQEEGVAG